MSGRKLGFPVRSAARPSVVRRRLSCARAKARTRPKARLMDTNKPALKIILALYFIVTGLTHFINTRFFLSIMPGWLPQPWQAVAINVTGTLQIAFGALLLVPSLTRLAGWGLIGVL